MWPCNISNHLYELVVDLIWYRFQICPLRQKCPNTEFYLVRIFWICTEYEEILPERYSISLSIQSKCGKIRTRKNSEFGHFSCSGLSWLFNLCQFTISFRKCGQNLFVTKQMGKSDMSKGLYIYEDNSIYRWRVLKFIICFQILLFLNNWSFVHLCRHCGWR